MTENKATTAPEQPTATSATWDKPSFWTKFFYSAPTFATVSMLAPISTELKIFYTDVLLVAPGLLALVTAIARAFDALTDPVMAFITDNTKTRWGRRKFYLPIGVPICALFYWAMFSPPRSLSSPVAIAVWAGVTFGFYYLFYTIWAIPYNALGLELTPDYDDRTSLFGIRAILGGIGVVISYIFLASLQTYHHWFADQRQMLTILTGSLSILMVLFFILPMFKVRENPDFAQRKGAPLIPGVRRALRNTPFRIILIAMVIASIASSIPPLLMPFFSKHILHLPNQYRAIYALIYVIAMTIAMPIWMRISFKHGKLSAMVLSSAIGGCISFTFWFVREGMVVIMGLLEVVRGFCAGSAGIIGPAMLADVVDYDELRTGKRREAQYSVFLSLLPKFISIIAASMPLAILGISGYDPSQETLPDIAILAIRSLFSWFPMIFQISVLLVIWKYPISKTVHQQIREGISLHQQNRDAVDPVTGKTLPSINMLKVNEDTGWFLDYFSVKELKMILDHGTRNAVRMVKRPITLSAVGFFVTIISTIGMLHDSMSNSQMDQLKQGIGSFLVIIAGLFFTLMIFHILRLGTAKKMAADPVDNEIIREHLKAI